MADHSPKIYPQQVVAMEKTMEVFLTTAYTYVILFAMMQSGKSDTFKLIACEMLRQGKIANVVVFSGVRDVALLAQTSDHSDFIDAYCTYLQENNISTSGFMTHIKKIITLGGQDLNAFQPLTGKTLYIWDESHCVQSERQTVEAFVKRLGMDLDGRNSNGNYILSVSATPFSELTNLHNFNQPKQVVRILPTEEYISVEKLRNTGRLHSIPDAAAKLRELAVTHFRAGYGIIRATDDKQAELEQIARSNKWAVREFNMTTKKKKDDINDILSKCPDVPTIIFIKGMLRMGKRLVKHHVLFGIETSANAKTDTLLQGLLGRWCGYVSHPFDVPVFIVNLNWTEIDKYKICFYEDDRCIPEFAQNIHGQHAVSCMATIPFYVSGKSATSNVSSEILEALDNGTLVNPNEGDKPSMELLIRTLCEARKKTERSAAEQEISKTQFHVHMSGLTFDDTFQRVKDSFASKKSDMYGQGYGRTTPDKDEIVIFRKKGTKDIYFYLLLNQAEQHLLPIASLKSITKSKMDGAEEQEVMYPHFNEYGRLEL